MLTRLLYVNYTSISSVQSLSHVWLCDPWTAACQASPSIINPRACSNSCPSSQWCHQPSHPLLSPSPPTFNLSQHQGLFQWVSYSHQVAKVLEFQLQHQSFQWMNSGLISFRMDWLDLLEVQGTLKSSPTPQFKRINSLALSFLYSPTLTSIQDYWKNHSLD